MNKEEDKREQNEENFTEILPMQENAEAEIEIEQREFDSAPNHPKQVMITDEELRALQRELLDYKDKYLRMLADAENARKRLQKEKQELTRYAIENVIVDFLHPLDNLENALSFAQNMSEEVKNWALGFQMILSQFKEVLTQHGVTKIVALGKLFDPHLHEAIEMIETDEQPAGIIIEECVRGYEMGNRLLRAARVKVAKSKSNEKKDSSEN